MSARSNIKKPSDHSLHARLKAVRVRFATRVDLLVARWLERCATNIGASQWSFEIDRKPTGEIGIGVSLVSSPHWDESP
jgi:hypothetical protein